MKKFIPTGDLYIKWDLISTCNYSCRHCELKQVNNESIFVKSRLIGICEKVLSLHRSAFHFTFGGGEPTIHPFIYDIIEYISQCGKQHKVELQTNGSQNNKFYMSLANTFIQDTFILNYNVHPGTIKAIELIDLIEGYSKYQQKLNIFIHDGANLSKETTSLMAALRALSKEYRFSFKLFQHKQTVYGCMNNFTELKKFPKKETLPVLISTEKNKEGRDKLDIHANCEQIAYGCLWSNLIYIDSGGYARAMMGGKPCSELPLWHDDCHIPSPDIYDLILNELPSLDNVIPTFTARDVAEEYLSEFIRLTKKWHYENFSIFPSSKALSRQDIVRLRLKRMYLKNTENDDIDIKECPDAVWAHMEELFNAHENLGTRESQRLLLLCARAMESGNSAYLGLAPAKTIEMCAAVSLEGDEGVLPMCLCESKEIDNEFFIAHRGFIQRHLPKIEVRLPWEPLIFYNSINYVTTHFPDYECNLQLREGIPFLLAESRHVVNNREFIGTSVQSDKRVLSIIINVTNDTKELDFIMKTMVQYRNEVQIIIVDSSKSQKGKRYFELNKNLFDIDDYAFEVNKDTGYFSILKHAHGSYLWIINTQYIIDYKNSLKRILDKTEDNADILIIDLPKSKSSKINNLESFQDREINFDTAIFILNSNYINGYGISSLIFKKSFHNSQMLSSGDTFINIYKFAIFALAEASNITLINCLSDVRHNNKKLLPNFKISLETLYREISILKDALSDIDINDRSKCIRNIINTLYILTKPNLLKSFSIELSANIYNIENKQQKFRQNISIPSEFLEIILKCYAQDYCNLRNINPDTQKFINIQTTVDGEYSDILPYGFADTPREEHIRLSIIKYATSLDDHLKKNLEHLEAVSLRNIEFIVIWYGEEDDDFFLLQDYADAHPLLRLYKCEQFDRSYLIEQIGTSLAIGDYIIFLNATAVIAEELLENFEKFLDSETDLFLFKRKIISIDGISRRVAFPYQKRVPISYVWELAKMDDMQGVILVFKTKFIKSMAIYSLGASLELVALAELVKRQSFACVCDCIAVELFSKYIYKDKSHYNSIDLHNGFNLIKLIASIDDLSVPGVIFPQKVYNILLPAIVQFYSGNDDRELPQEYLDILKNIPNIDWQILHSYARSTYLIDGSDNWSWS